MPDDTEPQDPAPETDATPAPDEGDDLGDAGKRALAAERAAAKAADKRAKALEAALATANTRILTAEVKAAAAGVLQDPDDAVRLIDLDQFEVDDDGTVDVKAIRAEIAALAKAKPYLSAGAKPAPLPGGGATPSNGTDANAWLRSKLDEARR